MEISTIKSNHNNNFDILRLVFAYFVIITHSYSLSGVEENDLLNQITNGQLKFSYLGVKGFFVISGYLIFKSMLRSESLFSYFKKRVLRLFPALIILLLICMIIVPFIYESDISLLKNRQYLTYFPNNLLLFRSQYKISGVFEHLPYPGIINGSFWTISYDFFLYIFISLLFIIKSKKIYILSVLIVFYLSLYYLFIFCEFQLKGLFFMNINFYDFTYVGSFFVAGALLAAINIHPKIYNILLVLGVVLLISTIILNQFIKFQFITIPLVVIMFGVQKGKTFIQQFLNKLGDISYGLYIYGFLFNNLFNIFSGLIMLT